MTDAARGVASVVRLALCAIVALACVGVLLGVVADAEGTLGDAPAASLQTDADFVQNESVECGNDAVELRHGGGEALAPEDLEIVVGLPASGHTERIVNLPAETRSLTDEQFEGDGRIVYDNCVRGPIAGDGTAWTRGDVVRFEINSGRTGGDVDPGDVVVVSVVHEPSGRTLATESLVAQ